jgi:hypothetical protein
MKGWTLKYCTRIPDISPNRAPVTTISTIASTGGRPAFTSITPDTEVKATTAPTDRSMPPARITKVSPTARMIR